MNKNKTLLKYGIALLILVGVTAAFIFGMELVRAGYPQETVQSGEDAAGNIVSQFFAVLVFFLMGLLLLLPFKSRLGMTHVMLLSYIVGILTFSFIAILLLSLHIFFALSSVLVVYCALAAVLYGFVLKKQKFSHTLEKEDGCKLVFWSLTILMAGYALSRVPLSILSYDSIQYDLLGKIYASEHYYVDYAYYMMGGQMLVPSLLNAAAGIFGFSFAYALQNMFTLSGAALFGYLLFAEVRSAGMEKGRAGWTTVLGTLLFAASFFYVFLGITLVPNSLAGLEILFLMVYLYRYSRSEKIEDLVLSLLFMLAFCYTRVEGPLIGAFVLAYLAHQNLPAKKLGTYTFVVAGGVLLGYISFFAHVGLDYTGDFLSLGRSTLSVGLMLAVGVYILVKEKWFKSYNRPLSWLYLAAVALFALGISTMDMGKFINNLRVMYLNMFAEGLWVAAWFGVILLGVLAIFMTKKKSTFLEGVIPIYLLLMLAIFAFRTTDLHINWSDSGNRLLMHIYPLVMFVLADNLATVFIKEKE